MNEKLLKEYIDRMGMVTGPELTAQAGLAGGPWQGAALSLLQNREIYPCRLGRGEETLVSLHLLFCLRAVYTEPELSPDAQELYDWLSDNELASASELAQSGLEERELKAALTELQTKLCVAPMLVGFARGSAEQAGALLENNHLVWVTDEYWMLGLHRPSRYNDLGYCLSEIKRLLKKHFSSREIEALIYHGAL